MTRQARIGLILFAIYLVFYGAFVGLNAFAPWTMATTPIAGINLAVPYGFALIVLALVLAALYGYLCRGSHDEPARRSHDAANRR